MSVRCNVRRGASQPKAQSGLLALIGLAPLLVYGLRKAAPTRNTATYRSHGGDPPPTKWSNLRYVSTSRRTAMARKRYKPEEIVAKLRQVDVLVSQGQDMADAIRQIGVSEVTYYRWRQEFGGLKIEQVKRLKEL